MNPKMIEELRILNFPKHCEYLIPQCLGKTPNIIVGEKVYPYHFSVINIQGDKVTFPLSKVEYEVIKKYSRRYTKVSRL